MRLALCKKNKNDFIDVDAIAVAAARPTMRFVSVKTESSQVISVILSSATDFKNGRNFTAWLGIVHRQYSTGGKPTLLGISKRGNKGLRELFVHGARAVFVRPEKAVAVFGNWILITIEETI